MSLFKRWFGGGRTLSYEQAKELASHQDASVRAELAGRDDVRPEILYFLAEDTSAEVRRRVAGNVASPAQANLLLAGDGDDAVRAGLAAKIAGLAPGLTPHEQDRLRRMTFEAVEMLARDQIPRVRQMLSEALKDLVDAPPEVIRRLARDAELAVSGPVLQYSPVLTDDDLIEIISVRPIAGALSAISRRSGVNTRVADAIAATDDVDAIAVLLGNQSAQIREETLDRLVDRASDIEAWHKPLVQRPQLPGRAAGKLARFIAAELLQTLAQRRDLDPAAAEAVARVVRKRFDEMDAPAGPAKAEAKRAADEAAALMRARSMHAAAQLDETAVDTALSSGDQAFVVAALSLLSGLPLESVNKVVATQSPKGMLAVCWKADLSPTLAVHLQTRMLHLPASRVLNPRGGDYPLRADEMEWQLEFFGA
ncbi:MAG: DUF2336 domain-containing protein [Magnetospirillum sp.]|nr:DUF2336 domain-containing protein [Magnetospirillum sp.]